MRLKNRTAVVTGAGSGIGRACALEFAKEGANVVAADINLDGARETVRLIEAANGTALAWQTDVANPGSVARLVDETLKAYSKVDALINNAAIQINKTVEDTTFEEWNLQMSINVGGVFLCSKLLLPHLRQTRDALSACPRSTAFSSSRSARGTARRKPP